MPSLSVNVNKIATLRNSRGGNLPDLLEFSELILNSGANGITIHPREDERHIKKTDVSVLKNFIDRYNENLQSKKEFNIEGEPSERFLKIILDHVPDQATLVPVTPGEITSDHGFNLSKDYQFLSPIIRKIKDQKIRVSLFIDAGSKDLRIAREIGADRIELYTGPFAFEFDKDRSLGEKSFVLYENTAIEAEKFGLGINAGHDLDHNNLCIFRKLTGLQEVSIGHRLISYALKVGIEKSVQDYIKALSGDS